MLCYIICPVPEVSRKIYGQHVCYAPNSFGMIVGTLLCGDPYSTLWPSTMLRCYNLTSLSLNPWVYVYRVYRLQWWALKMVFVARKWWNPRKNMLKIGDFWWITVCLHQILATSLCWVNCIANCFVTYYGATRPFLNLLVHNHLIQRRKSLMDSYVESSP